MSPSVHDCRLLDLPTVHDRRGNLTFVEEERHIPFAIKRVYYLYDVPGGAHRGGHAHKALNQFLIAAAGSFDAVLKDGAEERRITLNRAHYGLYIPPMIWRELDNFSTGGVCMALASQYYDHDDYIYDYDDYVRDVEAAR